MRVHVDRLPAYREDNIYYWELTSEKGNIHTIRATLEGETLFVEDHEIDGLINPEEGFTEKGCINEAVEVLKDLEPVIKIGNKAIVIDDIRRSMYV